MTLLDSKTTDKSGATKKIQNRIVGSHKEVVRDLWVVVACYNEERLIGDTLASLAKQYDRDFTLVIVNNNSTDKTVEIIQQYISNHKEMKIHLINESLKGTGAAADTGFRYAIQNGATHICRTDADSIPSAQWIQVLREDFNNGYRFIGGRISPRRDEEIYRWYDGLITWPAFRIGEHIPGLIHREAGQKYSIFMAAGHNLSIDSSLYIQAGGFPRSAIDDTDEDIELHLRVSKIIDRSQAKLSKKALVYTSIRRAKSMGYIKVVLWYWNRKCTTDTVDIRY